MRAVVKGISNDIFDVENYCPENIESFSLSLRIRIGLDCTQGADDFELLICTPKWLEETVWTERWGRGLLIVREYNFSTINELIHEYVNRCEGDSWEAIVIQLGKVFFWEFDDYQA
ncbi:immunity 8 family protein [Pseudomonas lijiangensis]|uniref:Immunity 8 family protein n=1 Tax=Pseudomonas lijiangensis TaxID=2995658 RepID=A0ABX8HW58_9PSED|nr:immunity 8 family protein [Pseudomonas lijiangensis]MBX8502718.1 immunity 8 family protein [Pseudomonas lijiangensis]MBX8507665.1 immunity 8 family protein [Pseudomonas lijiangensis]QWU84742.1 immunity 8 family protein [Pseudomonas lijiangensis]